ncbi:MAG: hypothetical protein RQ752_13485, partial [Thermohalobaculum sp.]|nr:hypothetical protein [Thermohalobaculum sp.]
MTDRRLLAIAGVAVTLGLAGAAGAHDGAMPGYRMMSPGFWTCPLCTGSDAEGVPGMGMGPGMMGGGMGYGMGPGM